jgi:hypothetical protein
MEGHHQDWQLSVDEYIAVCSGEIFRHEWRTCYDIACPAVCAVCVASANTVQTFAGMIVQCF